MKCRVALSVLAMLACQSASAGAEEATVEWNPAWRPFGWVDVGVTLGFGLAAAAAEFLYPSPQPNWKGGLPFDDAIRDELRLTNTSARRTAADVSDKIYYAMAAYPMVVDAGLVTLAVHRKPGVALQLALMDLESLAFTGAIALSAEKVGRVRPMATACARDPNYDYKCGNDDRLDRSFLSGHTTIAFSGAGLVCVHHQHLPLYGGGIAEPIACVTALVAASTAGVLRVMSDNHYGSDVILGAGVGLFGGYFLPLWLHYGFGSSSTPKSSLLPTFELGGWGDRIAAALAPMVTPEFAGLLLVGVTD